MSKPVQLHPARSPARIALAAAIAERARVADVLRLREGKLAANHVPETVWERRDEIERDLRRSTGMTGENVDAFRRMERTAALMRGEDPVDPVDPAIALRAELKEIDERIAASREAGERISADVEALREALTSAESHVRATAAAVMAAEGGRAALIAEHDRLAAQAAILLRAIEGAASPWIGGGPKPHHDAHAASRAALATPCSWAAAAERLRTDPDAPLPTIDAALAAVGSGQSARNAA